MQPPERRVVDVCEQAGPVSEVQFGDDPSRSRRLVFAFDERDRLAGSAEVCLSHDVRAKKPLLTKTRCESAVYRIAQRHLASLEGSVEGTRDGCVPDVEAERGIVRATGSIGVSLN